MGERSALLGRQPGPHPTCAGPVFPWQLLGGAQRQPHSSLATVTVPVAGLGLAKLPSRPHSHILLSPVPAPAE